ncbi:hypothetical protein JW933_11715 [candidate division FCPU426 bacterium]|nr:hypothetical protein [candidate division FCPU426 bacterium]
MKKRILQRRNIKKSEPGGKKKAVKPWRPKNFVVSCARTDKSGGRK